MSIILELRDRKSHAGIPLVHPASEHVVLANVFGVVKNLPPDTAINPWLATVTKGAIDPAQDWGFEFWERQEKPTGVLEGSTEVDLVISSRRDLVFAEVKLDAPPSMGTTADPERNQLLRNLDVGRRRALKENKRFTLIYITADLREPSLVQQVRNGQPPSPPPRVFWSSWGQIGETVARSVQAGAFGATERKFVLELLAYLCKMGLWENTLGDQEEFYASKLFRPLCKADSPFLPRESRNIDRDERWRGQKWEEGEFRKVLLSLRQKDQALLSLLARAGGSMSQGDIMRALPYLEGKSGALRALKNHINTACKGYNRMPILSEGVGSGDYRVHEINPALGPLRKVTIEIAKTFSLPGWKA